METIAMDLYYSVKEKIKNKLCNINYGPKEAIDEPGINKIQRGVLCPIYDNFQINICNIITPPIPPQNVSELLAILFIGRNYNGKH